MSSLEELNRRLAQIEHLWLFLDYDGTLVDFAPAPDKVDPTPEVAELVARLGQQPRLRVAIISGRGLRQLQLLLPVPGIILAGTYGIEIQTSEGKIVTRVDYSAIRPVLDDLKQCWEGLIAGRQGYFLEDKVWTLALHAHFAADAEAEEVLTAARRVASAASSSSLFRVFDGHRFFEIGPALAHKGRTVEYLLEHYPWAGAVPLYLGDDARDEEAFGVIKTFKGVSVLVTAVPRDTVAEYHLSSPQAARLWLETLIGGASSAVE